MNARSPELNPTRTQTLGAFLRAHRERLSPLALGVPITGRRRTPGLRREELAQLCGVSTTWYTWLEQGRPVSASAAALSRIAVALQLSRAEKLYLFEIARSVVPDSQETHESTVPSDLKSLVDQIPTPAYILDRQWNAVTWNRMASKLFRAWLVESQDRHLLRFVFLNPAARTLIVDWKTRARRLVAEFRSDAGRYLNEPPTLRLISELQTHSKLFAKYWGEQNVSAREGGIRAFRSNKGVISTYGQVSLIPSINTDLRLIALVPQASRAKPGGKSMS